MVKKTIIIIFIFLFAMFTNSCFIIYTEFVYDSDVDERRKEMYNLDFINSLPPLNTESTNYSFLVLADTHIEDGKINRLDRLSEIIVNYNNENANNIKFAVLLGDIAELGNQENLEAYMNLAKNEFAFLDVPFYPVIGNHDIIGNGWNNWKNHIGSTNYIVSDASNNATLIILDSANIYFGKSQLDWLEKELENITTKDVFVFTHVPLFAPGYLVQIDIEERSRMVSMLQNKCNVMFAGHIHTRYTQRIGNVDFISIESYRDDRTYCIVSITDSGITYTWRKL